MAMKEIVPFELEDGSKVWVEVEEDPRGGMHRVSRGEEDKDKPVGRFEKALDSVKPAAEAVLKSFRQINTPEEIGLEFGVKFNTKLGVAILASAGSEVTFKVSMKWTNPKDVLEKSETA